MRNRWIQILAVLLIATMAGAQTTASLSGRVTMDGNALQGVTVTVSSPALQGTRTTVSDVNGTYNFAALPPGDYTVRFEMDSMQTVTRTTRVGLGQTARADGDMRLSAMAEAITVTASAPAVLETTEVQTNMSAKLVDDLPVARTFQATANLAPGVNINSPSAAQLVISGAPAHENLFMVNGAVINENLRGQIHNLFIEDAIQETTVLTGAISAEYGRFTGGVVNSITKSGGNDFSGSFRDSLTNPAWSGKSFDGQTDFTDTINSVYEATAGGRIVRDRLWFFTAGRFAETTTDFTLHRSPVLFQFVDEETRVEGKLTGQITSKHNLMASYLDVKRPTRQNCFVACYEFSNIDPDRELPNSFMTAHYSGVMTSNFLVEANYSNKKFAFKNNGADERDFAHGTWGFDVNEGAFYGSPVFCGVCGPEERNNQYLDLKASYYKAAKSIGTHSFTAGYQDWSEQRISNNYQSGSNFGLYTFSRQTPITSADEVFKPRIARNDIIIWYPISELSEGSGFDTKSVYLNDKWDLNNHWSFNLGVRYDKNEGVDSAGATRADDSFISPRLAVNYDVFGDSRLRFNGSYAKYVAKVAESIGNAASPAGTPAYIFYRYRGPEISDLPSVEAFQQVYDWFQSQGGTEGLAPFFGVIPGVSVRFGGSLKSPNVTEYTAGVGSRIGKGYARVDVVSRDWADFYASRINRSTGQVIDQFGNPNDVQEIFTTNDVERTYRGASLQVAWPVSDRLQLGGNYTWSKTRGNVTAETNGSGPVTEIVFQYPEYVAFDQNNPTGFLPSDQTHKLRLFGTWTVPTSFGNFTFSALQRLDSGTPYSMLGKIAPPLDYVDPAIVEAYAGAPQTVDYYFGGRGALRWDDVTALDLSLNYRLPVGGFELFVQPEIINVFNENAVFLGDTTVLTANSDETLQPFNPFTETPVRGVHYELADTFGQARSVTDYQLARTYRVSVGVRF